MVGDNIAKFPTKKKHQLELIPVMSANMYHLQNCAFYPARPSDH